MVQTYQEKVLCTAEGDIHVSFLRIVLGKLYSVLLDFVCLFSPVGALDICYMKITEKVRHADLKQPFRIDECFEQL